MEDEKGPAHKKEFHIRLDLGTESHVGSGTSIKRAQHTAAETALNVTKLKRPVDRPARLTASSANIDKKSKLPMMLMMIFSPAPAINSHTIINNTYDCLFV